MPRLVAPREIRDRRSSSLGFIFSSERGSTAGQRATVRAASFSLSILYYQPPTPHTHTHTHSLSLHTALYFIQILPLSASLSWSFASCLTRVVGQSGGKLFNSSNTRCIVVFHPSLYSDNYISIPALNKHSQGDFPARSLSWFRQKNIKQQQIWWIWRCEM